MIGTSLLKNGIDTQHPWALVRMPGRSWRLAHALGKGAAFILQPFAPNTAPVRLQECTTPPPSFNAPLPSLNYTSTTESAHAALVQKALNSFDGTFEKVVVARLDVVEWKTQPHLPDVLDQLSARYPKAYVAAVYTPEHGLWVGASPERLVAKSESGFTTMALAGTRKASHLLDEPWTEKELHEQQVVADDVLERLTPFMLASPATKGPYYKAAGQLLHLCTDIHFRSPSPLDGLAKALHPTPAVCGYPREQALSFIAQHEDHERGLYAGYMGWIDGPEAEVFVWLRCMQMGANAAVLHVGGGITKSSEAKAEWTETVNKAQTLRRVLQDVLISPA